MSKVCVNYENMIIHIKVQQFSRCHIFSSSKIINFCGPMTQNKSIFINNVRKLVLSNFLTYIQ